MAMGLLPRCRTLSRAAQMGLLLLLCAAAAQARPWGPRLCAFVSLFRAPGHFFKHRRSAGILQRVLLF
jgi:hypothetical protein